MKNGSEAFERVWSAADALFAQTNRSGFPTVDAVRKAAQVNMNDASAAMREWRQRQLERASRTDVAVPVAVERTFRQALETLWLAAHASAGQALEAAQAAWDHEKAEADALSAEMGEAFDAQGRELTSVRETLAALETRRQEQQATNAKLQREFAACREAAAAARADMAKAVTKAEETERRASELRVELDHAHALLEYRVQADEAALAKERQAAASAMETAAVLRGELAAIKEQNQLLTNFVTQTNSHGAVGGAA